MPSFIYLFFLLPGRIINKSQTVQERLSAAPVGLEIRTYTLTRLPKDGGGWGGLCFWGLWYLSCLKAGTKAKGLSWDSAPPPPKPLWLNIDRKLVMFWVLPFKIWPGNQMKLDFGSVRLFCTNEYPIPERTEQLSLRHKEWKFKPNFQCRCDRLLCLINFWGLVLLCYASFPRSTYWCTRCSHFWQVWRTRPAGV